LVGEKKSGLKNLSDYPLSGWICHIAGKVSGSTNNPLAIQSDFIHDEDYLMAAPTRLVATVQEEK
jgi:hypothetical protein